MAGLIPFNRKNTSISRTGAGFEDFYNMLDDFFSDGLAPSRNLLRDTFKIDIEEMEDEYHIEAELPGVSKEDIELNIEDENLCISINRSDEVNKSGKNYIHRERHTSSMSRRIRLAGVSLNDIKAKLDNGVLTVIVPKDIKASSSRKIDIE